MKDKQSYFKLRFPISLFFHWIKNRVHLSMYTYLWMNALLRWSGQVACSHGIFFFHGNLHIDYLAQYYIIHTIVVLSTWISHRSLNNILNSSLWYIFHLPRIPDLNTLTIIFLHQASFIYKIIMFFHKASMLRSVNFLVLWNTQDFSVSNQYHVSCE